MPTFDEDLRERLAGAAERPGEHDDLFGEIMRRRRRRARTRKAGALVVVGLVLAVVGGGFLFIDRADTTTPQPAAPSVLNGGIVVSRSDSGDTHLYVLPAGTMDLDPTDGAHPDTSDQEPLTTGRAADVQPAVAPDGTRVAFLRCPRDPCAGGSVMVIGTDGSGEQTVRGAPDAVSVAWSPDGAWLAIADTEGAVWLVHPDGSARHTVAIPGVAQVAEVVWSADGSRLLLAGAREPGAPTDLWSVGLDGSNLIELTSTSGVAEREPAASPDGGSIVYVADGDIDRIPAGGGAAEELVGAPPPQDAALSRPAYSPDGAFLTFVISGMATATVYALPANTDSAFPITPGTTYAWQQLPASSAVVPPDPDTLGLPINVCGVTTMPITSDFGPGTAAVYTRENDDGSCPSHGHGYTAVGVDVDGDGRLDATYGPLLDCYFACEAFAAPDMTNDGTSEVTVSNAGANGYGVWLFRIGTSPPSITPVLHDGDPFQFTWLDVATHAASARCEPADGALPALLVDEVEKDPHPAQVTELTFVLDGDNAVPSGTHGYSTPLDQAPLPGSTLCGAPIHVPGARFGDAGGEATP